MFLSYVFCSFLILAEETICDKFTSIQKLNDIFSYEKLGVKALKKFVQETEEHLASVRSYLEDFNDASILGNKTVSLSNPGKPETPINDTKEMSKIIRFIRNMSRNFADFSELSTKHETEVATLVDVLNGTTASKYLPELEDYHGSLDAFLRLQIVYKFHPSELTGGSFLGVPTKAEFTSFDCINIATKAFYESHFDFAQQWMEEAKKLIKNEDNSDEMFSAVQQTIDHLEPMIKEKNSKTVHMMRNLKMKKLRKNAKLGDATNPVNTIVNFEKLCIGDKLLNDSFISTLNCYFTNQGSPYLTLMPVKVEVFYHQPLIVMYHDIISSRENFIIKQIAKPHLSRALINTGRGIASTKRTAQNYFFQIGEELRRLKGLNKRISYATGLHVEPTTSETLQVANYGVGGHYFPHYDFTKDTFAFNMSFGSQQEYFYKTRGDRVATFMLYLSDVERGGATVFPHLGVTLWPIKHAAAFWYNMEDNGEVDRTTMHGGCPVLFGSKWVANKWIRERVQFRTRPCSVRNTKSVRK